MRDDPTVLLHQILHDHGPSTDTELVSAVGAAGAALTADDIRNLLHDPDEMPLVACLPDGRHALLDVLLENRILTHRLTADEIALDVLSAAPDLGALARLLDEGSALLRLAGEFLEWGSDIEDERVLAIEDAGMEPDDVIALPEGALSAWDAGSVLGIRLGREGAAVSVVQPAAPPADLRGRVDALIRTGDLDGRPDGDETAEEDGGAPPMPVPIGQVVLALRADDPALFTEPLPPMGELLEQWGFTVVDAEVGVPGLDTDAWRASKDAARVAQAYEIDADAAMTVAGIRALVDAATDVAEGALSGGDDGADHDTDGLTDDLAAVADDRPERSTTPPSTTSFGRALRLAGVPEGADEEQAIGALTAPLADPDAAQALLAEAVGFARTPAIVLGALADSWEPLASRPARVALRWIQGQCRERLGRADLAEADFAAARGLDSQWPPVLEDLARYADDRGDAERAISLLRQAGVPDDDDDLQFLQGLRSPARTDLGRNQPCWCGSGRKYKVCHLGKESLPIESRAQWLYRKMDRFAQAGPFRDLIVELAARRSAFDTQEFALLRALQDPLVIDAVLFEGGAASEFVTERGFLLPADERALAERWLEQDRSVFEVEDVRVGRGFWVRNLRTGDRHDVTERAASRSLRRGNRLLMRVVPVGDTWQIFGGAEPLPMSMEQSALELCDALADGSAGPDELVSFATARFAPPELRTTDGQPMVFCTAQYRVTDARAVQAELDRRFDGDGHGQWTLTDGADRHPTVLASMELAGEELTATAMNETRFRSLQRQLATIDGLELIDVQQTSAAEMMRGAGEGTDPAAHGPAGGVRGGDPDELADSPDVRAVLEDYARDYENRWLDMSIPALGGATPREAADDPTRREDLVRLLDSFDGIDAGPGAMQPDRLRAALGM